MIYPYLLPEPDGLPTRPSGLWATEKLDYLRRYIDVFETSMRGRWSIRNYIDLQAGPGKIAIRDTSETMLGSPLLAVTTEHPFTGYFFADIDQENTAALLQRTAASPVQQRINVFTGDCNVLVYDIVARLREDESRSLNLVFLDPEGLEFQWSSVEALASIRKMDLIINYPQGGLTRYLPIAISNSGETSVDRFFGTDQWREIYAQFQSGPPMNLHRQLIDLYRNRLHGLGYSDVMRGDEAGDEPLMRNTQRNAPLYRLIFASKNPLGNDFWHKVTRRNVYGQRSLF